MKTVIDDIEINYYDQGKGEAVLFLHGWASSFDVFRPFLESLANSYRVCALDMPGFGRSQEPPVPWDVAGYAEFVAKFARRLGLSRAILIGHSFGGRVIIKLAGRDDPPLEIPKIILADSAGIKPKKSFKARLRQFAYKIVRRLISIEILEKSRPGLLEAWRRKHASRDYLAASPLMRQVLVKTVNEDLRPHLPRIKPPTLLIWGENDTATPPSDARVMESLIPSAGLAMLPNAGHYPFLDQPAIFGRVLDSFLNIKRG